jgi:hypothetical protein
MCRNRKRIAFTNRILENEDMKLRQARKMLSMLVTAFVMAFAPVGYAAESSSNDWSVDRVFFGAGGELEACSGDYCAKQTAGEIAAGHTAGAVFRANAGFNVEREPYIAFSVAGGPVDLGYLSKTATAYAYGTFAVKTYLASGYVVQLAADPPTNVGNPTHQINPLATPTAPAVGVEQFGINLRDNSSPNVGADPVQVPDNTFSFGTVAADYNTPNLFKYLKGDTIASSNESSGETDYTISFIYNIDELTAEGTYEFNAILVATSTY